MSHPLFRRSARAAGMLACLLTAYVMPAGATITFAPGTAFIQTNLTVSAPGGANGTWTPPALLLGTNVVEVNSSGTDVGGVKTTALDFAYTANAADVGKTFTVRWTVARPFSNDAVTTVDHVNSLDGVITYTGFNLLDISLRTITTQTDTDLHTLHLGPLPSGTPFAATITNSSPSFVQGIGNDRVIQFFSMQFAQTAGNGQLELNLPNSASSAISAVPEPTVSVMLFAGLVLGGFAVLRRWRKGAN